MQEIVEHRAGLRADVTGFVISCRIWLYPDPRRMACLSAAFLAAFFSKDVLPVLVRTVQYNPDRTGQHSIKEAQNRRVLCYCNTHACN